MPGDKKVFQSRRVNNRAFAFFGMLICTAILTFFLVRKILDIIYVDGIAVKYVQGMTADEYAKSIGATSIEKTIFGKRYGWDKDE